jgi:hypothetical protein
LTRKLEEQKYITAIRLYGIVPLLRQSSKSS